MYMYVSKLVTASFKLMISAFSHHDRVGLLTHVEEVAETNLTNQVQLCLFRIAQGLWAYCSFLCINGLYIRVIFRHTQKQMLLACAYTECKIT